MLPLKDDNPTTRPPIITLLVIAACVAVYFFVQPSGSASITGRNANDDASFTVEHAAIPCEIVQGHPLTVNELEATFQRGNTDACAKNDRSPEGFPHKSIYFALLLSMFLHAGLLHLGGNMLYLWVFGNNIEDRMGLVPFLLFYLLGGLAATFAHVALDPNSTVPVIGASGAIAAVMGAYLVLYPRARVHTAIFLGIVLFRPIPAWVVLGFWFLSQFIVDPTSGVAWAAHVGGFVFGVVVALIVRALGGRSQPSNPWDRAQIA
jgi:membrane associated rhomboid family serine protease